ncbi:MAG: GNAT family N-acetyltransferase, partial [Ktedonobacterales bacterium]
TQNDPVTTDNLRALATLDVYFGMALGCAVGDLRRPGWTFLAARRDDDPTALLFGRRALAYVVSPLPESAAQPRGGVALVAPELRVAVATLLRLFTPAELFTPTGRDTFDALVRSATTERIVAVDAGHMALRYTTRSHFAPYVGHLQEWIEALDESAEMEPLALSLLARHSGGVYVIREHGAIASFAGVRSDSPHVSEVSPRTVIERLRGQGLACAATSSATRAILAGDRVPLYRHAAGHVSSERLAAALGYRVYGDAITYFTESR